METKLNQLTAYQLRRKLIAGEISSGEIVKAHISEIGKINPLINSIITVCENQAMESADALDSESVSHRNTPLCGIPVTVKDHFATKGIRTTNGSQLFRDFVPDYDAAVVKKLKEAGAIILGKTNLPPFAIDFQGRNPTFGVTNNPWDLTRTSGGSTAGAAAVAAMISPLEIGSDLAGSLRIPAHFCGVFSFKATNGAINCEGLAPGIKGSSSQFDTTLLSIGCLSRCVADLKACFHIISDSHNSKKPHTDIPEVKPGSKDVKNIRIAYTDAWPGYPVSAGYAHAIHLFVENLKNTGFNVDKELPRQFMLDQVLKVYGEFLSCRVVRLPFFIRLLLKLSQKKLESKFAANQVVLNPGEKKFRSIMARRETYINSLETFLNDYDVLISPVTMGATPRHIIPDSYQGERAIYKKGIMIDGKEINYQKAMACFTIPFNVTGSPVVTIPIGFTKNNLPVGVQLIGKRQKDLDLLEIAEVIEEKLKIRCCMPDGIKI